MAEPSPSAIDPSVDPSPVSNLHVKSLADLAKLSDHLPVNWAELPRVPFYGPLLGFNDQWYRAAVALSVLETRWRGQRTLSPDEVQIVAAQTAKAVATMAHEVPLLLGTALVYERRGRATFRFPFYQPRETFNPDVFPTARVALLQGAAARSMWHATRFALYGSVSHWALRTLFISYTMSVKSAEFEHDPRLADLRGSIKQAAAARMSARRQTGPQPGQQHLPSRPVPPPPQQQQQQQQQDTAGDYGDASGASADRDFYERQQRGDGYPVDSLGGVPQAAAQQQQRQPLPYSRLRAPPPPPQTPSRDDYADLDDLDDGGYHDDASPLAPSERRRGWQKTASPAGGSAWDRLRAQAPTGQPSSGGGAQQASGGQQPGWGRPRRGQPPPPRGQQAGGDDYTFNEGDEEKSFAREQAQKDFDDMLEKERKGEGNNERRRRWS